MKNKIISSLAKISLVSTITLTPVITTVNSVNAASNTQNLSVVKSVENLEKLNNTMKTLIINYVKSNKSISGNTIKNYNAAIQTAKKQVATVKDKTLKAKLNVRINNASMMVNNLTVGKSIVTMKKDIDTLTIAYKQVKDTTGTLSASKVQSVVKTFNNNYDSVSKVNDKTLKNTFTAQLNVAKGKIGVLQKYIELQTASSYMSNATIKFQSTFKLTDLESSIDFYNEFNIVVTKYSKLFNGSDEVTNKFKEKYYTPAVNLKNYYTMVTNTNKLLASFENEMFNYTSISVLRDKYELVKTTINSISDKNTKDYFNSKLTGIVGEVYFSSPGFEINSKDIDGLIFKVESVKINGSSYEVKIVESNNNMQSIQTGDIKWYSKNGSPIITKGGYTLRPGDTKESTLTITNPSNIYMFEYGYGLKETTDITIHSIVLKMEAYTNPLEEIPQS
ncbi:hypothetical protein [Gottfriedia solisilvae]|uniref:hypothetical protein n=1 Tax=Gottfriedia solisilvae TaxID=1516104 RepID=UPI003D2EB4A3